MANKIGMKDREYLRIANRMLEENERRKAAGETPSLNEAQEVVLGHYTTMGDFKGNRSAKALAAQSLLYGSQGAQQREDVARGLVSGASARPLKADINALNGGTVRQGVIDIAAASEYMRGRGMFDDPRFINDPAYKHLVSTDYYKTASKNAKTSASVGRVADASRAAAQFASDASYDRYRKTWDQWARLYNEADPESERDWAYVDYLLRGDISKPFDIDAVDATWSNLSDEEYEAEMQRLKSQYDSTDLAWFADQRNVDPAYTPWQSNVGMWEGKAEEYDAEIARRTELDTMRASIRGSEDYDENSVYVDTFSVAPGTPDSTAQILRKGNLRNTQVWINSNDPGKYMGIDTDSVIFKQYTDAGYDMMTPDEIADYNYLYNTGRYEDARRYLELIQPELWQRRAQYQYLMTSVYTENPLIGGIGSVATVLTSPVTSAVTFVGGITGNADPNAPIYDMQRWKDTTRGVYGQEVAGEWFDGLKFLGQPLGTTLYSGLMSIGDMAMAYGVSGGIAGGNAALAQKLMPIVMSSTAATDTFHGDLVKGFSLPVAALHGAMVGSVEYFTEKLPIDTIFNAKGNFATRVLKSGAAEGTEEFVSGGAGIVMDILFSHMDGKKSDVEMVYEDALSKSGDPRKATTDTLLYFVQDLVLQTMTGAFTGGTIGAVAHGTNDSYARKAGKDFSANGDVNALVSIGQQMPEGSESRAWADRIADRQKNGKKIRNYDVGQLTMAIEAETSQELADAPNRVMDEAIVERQVELGVSRETAEANAPAIRKMYRGQKMTMEERRAFKHSDVAEQVVKELSREVAEEDIGRPGTVWTQGIGEKTLEAQAPGYARIADLSRAYTKEAFESAPAEEAQPAYAETAKKAAERAKTVTVRKGDKVPMPAEGKVWFGQGESEVTGKAGRFVKDGDALMLEVVGENGTTKVNPEELSKSDHDGVAAIISYVAEANSNADGTHAMSAEEANTMLKAYMVEGGDAGKFIEGFERAYLAGYAGIEAGEAGISKAAAQMAYDQGKAEAAADEKHRVQRAQEAKAASRGTVAWLGMVTNNGMVRGDGDVNGLSAAMETMTESQRTTAEVVQALAEKMKIDVVLFESSAEMMEGIQNGSFVPGTNRIYIDVNAGAANAQSLTEQKAKGTLGYAMMKTLAHELTHYMEANSAQGYSIYKQSVKNALKDAGEDWATLVRGKIDTAILHGTKLTLAGAEAEVVADASEYMLQNSSFVQGLDNSVRGKVKKFIQTFMEKVRSIFANLSGGHRESVALRQAISGVMQYTGNLQRLWDAGIREATGRNYAENATMRSSNTVAEEEVWTPEQEDATVEEWTAEPTQTVAEEEAWTPEQVQYSGREDISDAIQVSELPVERQFALRSSVEKREDGLMAMHNLKLDDMWGTIRLGGFPMPSIAIVKAKHGHTMYGPYSVIFGRKTIDPEEDYRNRVYGADAWTPVFPQVETELLGDAMYDVQDEIATLAAQVDDEFKHRANTFFGYFSGDDSTRYTMDDLLHKAWNNYGMLGAYMIQRGEKVNILERDVEVDRGFYPSRADVYDAILDVVGNDIIDMPMHQILDVYGEQLALIKPPFARMIANWKGGDRQAGARMAEIIKQAIAYEGSGRDNSAQTTKKKDYYDTENALKTSIDREDFNAWMSKKVERFFGEQGVYNGKDRFTPSGNRRTFKQTHMPLTAENVVKSMLTQQESNISATDAHGLMAAAASRYDSVDEIRADSARLGKISDEEYRARLADADNDLRSFLNAIEAWDYDKQEEVGDLLVQAAKGKMSAARIKTLFAKHGYAISVDATKMATRLLDKVQSIPTGYFEAKPARVVSFDEVRMVVAPQDMPTELAAKLDELGIPHTSYDGTDEDRIAKSNAVEGAKFSNRDLAGAIDIRDYLGNMKERPSMTETEKILLKRYQGTLQKLKEAEANAEEQLQIIKTVDAVDEDGKTNKELTKAKNRWKIYRDQANRYSKILLATESEGGFARLMATSQEVLNRYLLGSAGNVADAADALDEEVEGLTKQLKVVEADVTRTSQAQRTAFSRGLFDQQTLNMAAQKLKDAYGSRMSVKTIADRLALVYGEIYADPGAEGAKRFAEAAKELAYDILQRNKYRYKSESLPMLAEMIGTISLTETDMQEIKNAGMTISEYKKALAPWVKIAEGASDLSSVASNAAYYGDGALAAILGDDTEGNLAMNLYNYIQQEKAREREIGVEGMSEGEMITAVMADIAGSDLPLSTNSKTAEYLRNEMKKFAGDSAVAAQNIEQMIMNAQKATTKASDVWRAAVKEVETAKKAVEYYRALDEHRRVMELREQKQIITEELKSDAAKKLQEKVKAQREEFRAREQKAREYRHAREDMEKIRRKVGRDIKRLNTLRVRETDKKHVPQEFQALADAIMRTFTDSELSRLAFSAEKTASLQRTYRILGEMESDFTYYWDDEVQSDIDNLVSLSEAYSALKKRGPGVPSYLSLEGVELEVEILQGVDNIVSNALNMIDMANRKFLASRQETFEAYANRTGENLVSRKDHKVLKGERGEWQTILDETFRTGNMTPVYFFEHLENPEIKAVFDEIRNGVREAAKIEAKGKAFVEATKEKYHYGKWVADGKLKMKTGQGHTIELTREEAAELYALYKREQANKLYQTVHLLKGGFQYRNIAEKVSEDGKTRAKDNPHQLDAADMARISEWLTEEQKAYADALVGFLSTTMADYGNAASMSMYGYKKFTESYYIPFRTVANQRQQKGDEGAKGEDAGTGRLRNAGFTNKVQHKADATLYIGGITETVADHIHKMAAYSAMVQPIEDLKRLLNHKVVEGDGTINTIRALIGQKYGKASENYVNQLLKDLNGATQSDNRASGLLDKLIGAFKRGAVMGSVSVLLQQPTAMARAMAYIDPKYFAQNPFYRPSKGTWEEMMEYSGAAVIKDMGKFDVGLGKTATQYIAGEDLSVFETYRRLKADSKYKAGKAAFNRFIEWLTSAPGAADQWTWGLIWKAVKAEQAALHPEMDVNSEEFLQMCGDRFDDVADHTQVYDSPITKSDLMRSSNLLHKMATSFKSEPTLTLNVLYSAFRGKHGKKQAARIIGSVLASQILAGLMAAIPQAFNDDDDERNWAEKYLGRATENVLDNLNPFGMIPYISDILGLMQGYDVERADMSVISTLFKYTSSFVNKIANGQELTMKDWENFAGNWFNLTGIPAKNILREIRRTRNAIFGTKWSAPDASALGYAMLENTKVLGLIPVWSGKPAAYYDRMVTAMIHGDDALAEDYRSYLLDSKARTEDQIEKGLRDAYKERYLEGDIDEDTAMDFLIKNGLAEDEAAAYDYVSKWEYSRDRGGSTEGWSRYLEYEQAIETGGQTLIDTTKMYLDQGVAKSTLKGRITDAYQKKLIDLHKSGRTREFADLQAKVLTAYQVLGYDRDECLKMIQGWLE